MENTEKTMAPAPVQLPKFNISSIKNKERRRALFRKMKVEERKVVALSHIIAHLDYWFVILLTDCTRNLTFSHILCKIKLQVFQIRNPYAAHRLVTWPCSFDLSTTSVITEHQRIPTLLRWLIL